ncbi:MAG: alcohol dehydrogenase catalytic domain-containing protein [Cyclobacteriaceae bacterium]|nr:alcohol dehydrogenase catalytic domain-containing protein [Cyclobacteriaceae bacterium]
MKAMVLTGIRQMEMIEVPDPQIINHTDVLIKMERVGVCGSDIHYYTTGKIGSQVVQYPFAVGHEGAGTVVQTGQAVTRVKAGDQIAIEPAMPCWHCDQCEAGRPHTCRNLLFLGCPGQAEGCLSEYIVMPETSCFKLENDMNLDDGALSEPLAIGVYAVKQSVPMQGASVGILGFGPIGMSVLLPAVAQGASSVYVTDKVAGRLDKARSLGVKYAGNPDEEDVVEKISALEPNMLDVVFECCGKQEALENALDLLKPGGKLMMIGIPEFDYWQLSADKGRRKEITFVNVRRQNHALEPTLEMMQNKVFDARQMMTHRFKFEQTKEAFDLVDHYADGVMKAMIEF